MVTGWNPQAEHIFGWRADEVIGQSLTTTIIPPRYREGHERGLRRYAETGTGPVLNKRIEITALDRTGREFPVELAITPMHLDGQTIFSAFLRDITEQRCTEAALRESHDLLSNLARLVPGVVYQYRLYPDGRSAFPYASPGMNEIYEVTPEAWRHGWDLKVFGYIDLTRIILPRMYERRSGNVVNVVGVAAEVPNPAYIAGCMGNAALNMFTHVLGGEAVEYGVWELL